MMLHYREDNFIAGIKTWCRKGRGDEIDRFRATLGEDDLIGVRRIDEAPHGLARRLVSLRSRSREEMNAAVYVGVLGGGEAVHRFQNLARLLRRGGIVEIHQWFAIDGLGEDLEVGARGFRVESRCDLRLRGHDTCSIARARPFSTMSQAALRVLSSAIGRTASSRKARMRRLRASLSLTPRE